MDNHDSMDAVPHGKCTATTNEHGGVTAQERRRANLRVEQYLDSDLPCSDYADLFDTMLREGKV